MLRILAPLAIAFCLVSASAQTQTTTSLASSSPLENAAGGAVSRRAPGTWVKASLARHLGLQALRLTGPRFGHPNTTEALAQFGPASTTPATTTSGLSGLLSLVSQLGASGSLGNLTSLLGNLTGTGTTPTTPTTAGTSTTGTGTNFSLADLIALGQTAGATQKTINAAAQDSAATTAKVAGTAQTRTFGGAVGRLPKPETFQSNTTTTTQPADTPGFGTRWLTAMTQTFFTAITVGFQTPLFVTALKDALRPLFLPPAQQTTNTSSNNTSGSGIENIPATTNGSGSSTL